MARAILVIGEPGTGKSRALKDLDPLKTVIIKPNKKELPFAGAAKNYVAGKNVITTTNLKDVGIWLDKINKSYPHIINVVIEDITHFFTKRTVDERRVAGYGKWMELAASIKQNIVDKEAFLRDNLTLFVIGHVDEKKDKSGNSELSLHTPGKLLDRSILIPSYFTYMLHTDLIAKADGTMQYRFLTNRTTSKVAKTPEGIFPTYIINNYELVKRYIEAYQMGTEVNLEGISEGIEVSQEVIQVVPDVEVPIAAEEGEISITEDVTEGIEQDTPGLETSGINDVDAPSI